MKFTFNPNLRFHCQKCGGCCIQSSIDLSDKEYDSLKMQLDSSQYSTKYFDGVRFSYAPWNISFSDVKCPFLKENLCSIYNKRYGVCRLYPFEIIELPSDEIQVELIHCPGVNDKNGSHINEAYINQLISELNQYDAEFYSKYVKSKEYTREWVSGFYIYDCVTYESKINFRKNMIKWFTDPQLIDYPLEIKYGAIYHLLYSEFKNIFNSYIDKLGYYGVKPPILLFNVDISYLFNNLNRIFKSKIIEYIEYETKLKNITMKTDRGDKGVYYENFKKIEKNMNEEVYFETRNKEKINFSLNDTLADKKWSQESLILGNEYLIEVASRLGRAGIMIETSLLETLDILGKMSISLWNTAKVFSKDDEEITKESVIESISHLDERTVSKQINNAVLKEHRGHLLN